MDVNINKIKQTCLSLGFPQNFINALYIDKFENNNQYTGDDVLTNDGIKLGAIYIGRSVDTDHNFIIFSFDNPQEFIKQYILTHYNKQDEANYGAGCCIEFDDDSNFLNFTVSDNYLAYNAYYQAPFELTVYFKFNEQLVLESIKTIAYMKSNPNLHTKLFESEKTALMSLSDEILLLDFLRYSYTPSVIEIVPEFYIPSAYDFNSEELKRRIVLVEMLQFQ